MPGLSSLLRPFAAARAATRMAPEFLIIGTQRGGTTSLYNYLGEHPTIEPLRRREVHFFDIQFARGMSWYRSRFPSCARRLRARIRGLPRLITGESSPYYLFHPLTAERVAAALPEVKLIVLLRNPVNRAYSHLHLVRKKKQETLEFAQAIDAEAERLRGEEEKICADGDYYSASHQQHSYLARGIYADQLERWLAVFPREQFLILRSEDLYENPRAIVQQTLRFLQPDCPDTWALPEYKKYNDTSYQRMEPELRQRLTDFFRPHNQRLARLLGRDFGWESGSVVE